MGHHICQKCPCIGKFLFHRSRHLIDKGTLSMDYLVMGDRQNKILGESVEKGKCQIIVIKGTIQRVQGHIVKHIVHPAHVPLIVEAQAAGVGRLGNHRPGGRFLCDHHHVRLYREGRLVQALQKRHRLQVFLTAVLIGHPFPILAAVVQIQHRSHRVAPDAIDVVLFQPEHGAGNQEADDLIPAVVKHQGSPILMLAFSRVRILVAAGSVKFCQPVDVPGEMSRHPIHNYADSRLMAPVHKAHKLLRVAVAGGRRKIAGHLIAPGTVVWILRHRHQLDMGISHLLHVRDQLIGELFIGKRIAVGELSPGTGMDLVNIHRIGIVGMLCLILIPGIVVPLIAVQTVKFGRVGGAGLIMISVGIRFHQHFAILRGNSIAVNVIFLDLVRDKTLPDPAFRNSLHRIFLFIPAVELTDHGYLSRVWGPGTKNNALFPILLQLMGA